MVFFTYRLNENTGFHFLKVGFGRVFRVPDVITRTGPRLFVICGKNIDGRGQESKVRLKLDWKWFQAFNFELSA
jgi:hypothetical protein